MRVLMLSWEYPPHLVGGLGRHVAELSLALAEQQIIVHVVTPTTEPENAFTSLEKGVMIHRVFAPAMKLEANIYNQAIAVNQILCDYVGRMDEVFDIIHVHDWLTGFAGMDLQMSLKRPLVATIHATERGRGCGHINNDLQQAIDGAEQRLIERANRVIVCSHYMLHEVQTFFHTPTSRLEVVFNGVNLDDLRNGHSKEQLIAFRARCADPDERIVFAVARLVHEKGFHRLVEAAPRILAEFPQTRIIIAGRGPEANNLKRQAYHLGVADRVDFVGFISDEQRDEYYQTASCAVFPSLYEPFGIVALEAMALGCPVVVSEVGGLSEIVKHEETGVTIYPDNADSVAWGVLHILQDPSRALTYAARAYQAVEELYNWSRIARLTRGVYRRTVDKYLAPVSI
ncbi:MAG: glycosyltransferase family 4 protein [Anaerolineae bacterium]|nr:glycosyltransferase family 4 protein [Anaerolineae bacterium]